MPLILQNVFTMAKKGYKNKNALTKQNILLHSIATCYKIMYNKIEIICLH